MAATMIDTPNGLHIITCPEDFKSIVSQQLGYEAGEYVQELINASKTTTTDHLHHELENEAFNRALDGVQETTNQLLEHIFHAQRIDRSKIASMLLRITTILNNID